MTCLDAVAREESPELSAVPPDQVSESRTRAATFLYPDLGETLQSLGNWASSRDGFEEIGGRVEHDRFTPRRRKTIML
ncbi:MAG: hypothetical protein QNI94_04470 [Kiloniellales bacterium]|nr:hypothetical protein [Kiloniellales bacterium]